MSIDSTLKRGSRLSRSRNVLTRDERIAIMLGRGTFDAEGSDADSPFGLPKTRVAKASSGKKKKKKKKDEDEG